MNEVALWSQESQRGRSSVKPRRTKDGREGKGGREGGRRKRRGYIQQGGNVKQWTSIKSARDWGWMRVAEECEGKSRLSVFLHERLRVFALRCSTCKKASSTQTENNPSHDGVTFLWNRPAGLQGHEGSLFKCTRSLPVIAMDSEDPTDETKSLLATLYSCQKTAWQRFWRFWQGTFISQRGVSASLMPFIYGRKLPKCTLWHFCFLLGNCYFCHRLAIIIWLLGEVAMFLEIKGLQMIFRTFQLLFGGTKSWWFVFHEKASQYDTSWTGFSPNFVGVFVPLHVIFWRALISLIYTIPGLSLLQFSFSFPTITALQCLLSKDCGFCLNARLLLNKNRHTLL